MAEEKTEYMFCFESMSSNGWSVNEIVINACGSDVHDAFKEAKELYAAGGHRPWFSVWVEVDGEVLTAL